MSIPLTGTPPIGTASVTGSATLTAANTTGYTSAALLCDSSGGSFTITLPKPTDLARAFRLTLVDIAGAAASHPVSILNSASTVQGISISTALQVLNVNGATLVLSTTGGSDAWTISSAYGPTDQVYSWARVTNVLSATVNGTSYVSGIVPQASHASTADSLVGGGVPGTWAVASRSADFTAAVWTRYAVNTTSADVTATLPAASTCTGKGIAFKKILPANGLIISSTDLIDGRLAQTLTAQWSSVTVYSTGSTWYIA